MTSDDLKALSIPDEPGVYFFLGEKKEILYIGKATSLRDRVRSYFSNDILHTRGKHILDMVSVAKTIRYETTASAIEALIKEAALIKTHQPIYNTKEKDDKSFNYVVVTNEEFPRVLTVRERTMLSGGGTSGMYRYVFGPFPHGGSIVLGLKILRKIFPFRDSCSPNSGKPCFNRQIGLCPGVCTGEISKKEYEKQIQHIRMFFEGKKDQVLKRLHSEMRQYAKAFEFEKAGECKRTIFSLEHIKDVSLLDEDIRRESQKKSQMRRIPFRIEAYDIAHISGAHTVGVMVTVHDGMPWKSGYRKFRIRSLEKNNDVVHLEEVLRRRFTHREWQRPDIIVVDGGETQKRRAQKVIKELSINIPVLSVVKDDRHKARGILGDKDIAERHKQSIILANTESHRFAVTYHRVLRGKLP